MIAEFTPSTWDRRRVILVTVAVKAVIVATGAYVTYAFYQSGVEILVLGALVGWGVATVQVLRDLRAGRKPWLPMGREVADDLTGPGYVGRGATVGTTLGKLTAIAFAGYATYVVYVAGMESLAFGLAIAAGLYVLGRLWTDLRAGRKPWVPTRRVQRSDLA